MKDNLPVGFWIGLSCVFSPTKAMKIALCRLRCSYIWFGPAEVQVHLKNDTKIALHILTDTPFDAALHPAWHSLVHENSNLVQAGKKPLACIKLAIRLGLRLDQVCAGTKIQHSESDHL